MNTLDFTQVLIQKVITHHVGNKLRDEKYLLSSELTNVDSKTKDILLKYFLLPLKTEELFSFFHSVSIELNGVYGIMANMFSHKNTFVISSQDIAKLLYDQSMHPKIKEGELSIVQFSNIILDDVIVDAIGIFKSENSIPYLKFKRDAKSFDITHETGFDVKGMDKGCVVFNMKKDEGYRVLVVDNMNRSEEAQYWKDDFLKLRATSNEFHQTNQFLGIAKNFLTKQISQEFEVSKTMKIDLLNKSFEYFKTRENFDRIDFENNVLKNAEVIKSFRNYNEEYKHKNEIDISDDFVISQKAVKKQARVFKKVLKLDKNFQIYIQGDRELIEQGVEKDGRKYYKIYYKEES